jgi:hypothetical protein
VVNKEKLVDANVESITQLLCDCQYGEHDIVIYPDLSSFREIYARLTRARIGSWNDKVILLPHYETAKSVEQALMELEVSAKEEASRGSLEVIDSYHAFFDPEQTFLQVVSAALNDAQRAGKSGAIIIADMGSFYHRQAIESLISHECRIPSRKADVKSNIFCCYNYKDFQKLTKAQEEKICENHYRNLFVRARDT